MRTSEKQIGDRSMSKLSNDGFSLVELMVVTAIGAVIMLGIMQMASNQSKVARTGDLDRQVSAIKTQVQLWLNDPSVCTATMAGKVPGKSASPGEAEAFNPYQIQGIKSSITQADTATNDSDFLMQVNHRFMGTNWSVSKIELLSMDAIRGKYGNDGKSLTQVTPAYGTATGILKITITLLAGTTGDKIMTAQDNRNANTTLNKSFEVRFQARFALHWTIIPAMPNFFTYQTAKSNGDYCKLGATPGHDADGNLDSATYEQHVTDFETKELGSTHPIGADNPIYFISSLDEAAQKVSGTTSIDAQLEECYVANYNMPIVSCVLPSGVPYE